MAVLTHLPKEVIAELLALYGDFTLLSFDGIAAGSVNSNYRVNTSAGPLFLRLYEEQDVAGAMREAELLCALAEKGIPTPNPLRARDGRWVCQVLDKPCALFPWRPGNMLCQASVTTDIAEKVGELLGRIHVSRSDGPAWESRFRLQDLSLRLEHIEHHGSAQLLAELPKLRELHSVLSRTRNGHLPMGLIHGDLFRDNVLWNDDGTVSAVLDFESASRGPLLFDLAVTALAWCVGDSLSWPLLRAIVRGYERLRVLSAPELQAFRTEALVAALRFTTTRITDYAMRAVEGPRVIKDWRRFRMRIHTLEALSDNEFIERLRS